MTTTKLQPEFIKRLLLLEQFLKGTPEDYHKEDFHPHVTALRIVLSGDQSVYLKYLEECKTKLDKGIAEIVPYASDGFPDAILSLATFLDTFAESRDLVTNMNSALQRDKKILNVDTGDVKAMYYRSVRLTESIHILDLVEDTLTVLKTVDQQLRDGKIVQAAETLVRGESVATSKQLSQIRALDQTREDISRRRQSLFETMVNNLSNLLYTGSTLSDSAQAQKGGGRQGSMDELVNSLRILAGERELLQAVSRRIPSALDDLVLDAFLWSRADDVDKHTDEEVGILVNRYPSREAIYHASILDHLSRMLPSAQAPKQSKEICTAILEQARESFADTLNNHVQLLSRLSTETVKELSAGSLWNMMQNKLIELTNVLIGSVRPSARDLFRKELAVSGKSSISSMNVYTNEFSFLPNMQISEKLDVDLSAFQVAQSIQGLIPSKYNVPELHPSILKAAQDGARTAPDSSNLLVVHADNMMRKELMEKLQQDLDSYVHCVAGNATSLINMDSTTEGDNAALPTLPAIIGVERILEEVIVLASVTASHPSHFSSCSARFLGLFRNRCWVALHAAELWTPAGRLLTDPAFIGEMQLRMEMFFLQTAALGRENTAKRNRAPAMPDLDTNTSNNRAKFQALYSILDGIEDFSSVSGEDPLQKHTFSTSELKAIVRFISSLYLMVRKIENPSKFGSSAEHDGVESQATNLLEHEKEKQRLQMIGKVTMQLLQSLTGEAGMLLEVADKGVMLLRIDMQSKIYLKLLDFYHTVCKKTPSELESEHMGVQLGKILVDFERVVKFNLDVTKREYIFNDMDSVFAVFLERIKAKLKASRHLNERNAAVMRSFFRGTQKTHELFNELHDSASKRAVAEIQADTR